MSNLTVYFTDADDYLRIWFKQTYQGSTSGILKDYVKRLYEASMNGEQEADPADRTREILQSVFSDVADSGTESAWLTEMRESRMNGPDIIHRRLTDLKSRYPELARYAEDEFQKLYPVLAKAGGITE